MKTSNFMAALIATATIATIASAQPPRGQGRGHDGPPPSHPIVDAIDQNQDHEISAEEIANASKNLLSLDKNNDGILNADDLGHMGPPHSSRQEGQRGQRRSGGEGGSNSFATRLLAFDENGNGKLEKDELPERMQGMIDRIDTNGDGVIDQDELQAMGGGGAGAGQQRGRRGGNGGQGGGNRQRGRGEGGGGGGSRADFFIERAMSFDANEDGLLSEDELREMMENMPQRGGRGGGQGGAGGGRGRSGGGGGGRPRAGSRPE